MSPMDGDDENGKFEPFFVRPKYDNIFIQDENIKTSENLFENLSVSL